MVSIHNELFQITHFLILLHTAIERLQQRSESRVGTLLPWAAKYAGIYRPGNNLLLGQKGKKLYIETNSRPK